MTGRPRRSRPTTAGSRDARADAKDPNDAKAQSTGPSPAIKSIAAACAATAGRGGVHVPAAPRPGAPPPATPTSAAGRRPRSSATPAAASTSSSTPTTPARPNTSTSSTAPGSSRRSATAPEGPATASPARRRSSPRSIAARPRCSAVTRRRRALATGAAHHGYRAPLWDALSSLPRAMTGDSQGLWSFPRRRLWCAIAFGALRLRARRLGLRRRPSGRARLRVDARFEPIRDSTLVLEGENGPGVVIYGTGGPGGGVPKSATYWTLNLSTGAVQNYGAQLPAAIRPPLLRRRRPSPYTCALRFRRSGRRLHASDCRQQHGRGDRNRQRLLLTFPLLSVPAPTAR